MKPHLIIKINHEILKTPPHWRDLIDVPLKERPKKFFQAADKVFEKYKLPFYISLEYKVAGKKWNKEEIASGLNRIYRLILKNNVRIPSGLIKEIREIPQVEYIKIGTIGVSDRVDTIAKGFGFEKMDWARKSIYLKEAHLWSKGHPGIKVAILDTGVQLSHPEIRHALIKGFDFVNIINGANTFIGDFLTADPIPEDEVGHGTHVAGIIAGAGKSMPVGVVPKCKIIPVRVLASMKIGKKKVGAGLIGNINNGIKWAVDQGASVINMSLGVRHKGGGLPHAEVIQYALSKGVSIIAASGNDGANSMYYPGALPGVLAIGANGREGLPAQFSTWGKHVSFTAPGIQIYSSFLGSGYAFSSGTSHASPFVAGTTALLRSYALQLGYRLNNKHISHILKHTSDKQPKTIRSHRTGYGQVNAADAIRYLNLKIKNYN